MLSYTLWTRTKAEDVSRGCNLGKFCVHLFIYFLRKASRAGPKFALFTYERLFDLRTI